MCRSRIIIKGAISKPRLQHSSSAHTSTKTFSIKTTASIFKFKTQTRFNEMASKIFVFIFAVSLILALQANSTVLSATDPIKNEKMNAHVDLPTGVKQGRTCSVSRRCANQECFVCCAGNNCGGNPDCEGRTNIVDPNCGCARAGSFCSGSCC